MSGYVIQPTGDPPFVTCKTCDGRGYVTALKWGIDPYWCPECGGAKEIALDMTALATLAHNLGVAGALCRSFHLGGKHADDLWARDHVVGNPDAWLWRPGCWRPAP